MRASTTLLLTLASATTILAQQAILIPDCAQPCVSAGFGNCKGIDAKCICTTQNLIAELACCVGKKCNAADQAATLAFAHTICDTYTNNLPKAATCASSAGSSSTASAASSSSGSASSVTGTSSAASSSGSSGSQTTLSGSKSQTSGPASAATASPTGGAGTVQNMGLGMVVAGVLAVL